MIADCAAPAEQWPPLPLPVAYGSNPGFKSASLEPLPLHLAIIRDQLDEVRRLLESGADPNARWGDYGDHFPLEAVIIWGPSVGQPITNRAAIVALLLKHGADSNARWCPFETRHSYDTRLPPSCTSATGITPLIAAAMLDQAETVELLLTAGADPHMISASGATALERARSRRVMALLADAMFPGSANPESDALKYLNEHDAGTATDPPGPADETPLTRAIANQIPFEFIVPPPPPPPPGKPGELGVAYNRREGRVALLLRFGADPNRRLTWGAVDWTPLSLAIFHSLPHTVDILLEHGADPNARWCVSITRIRDEAPAPHPSCTLQNGISPLMYAASMGRADVTTLLLEYRADPAAQDWAGRTVSDYQRFGATRR